LVVIALIVSLYLVMRSKSDKIITFEECAKAGWLVCSITLYDGDNLIIEKNVSYGLAGDLTNKDQ